jgi:hypothetical protein
VGQHFRVVAVGLLLTFCVARSTAADPIRLGWPQPGGPGTEVVITYSYSNLLDGSFLLTPSSVLRRATEEALRIWASYAPLHFVERSDFGPAADDRSYPVAGTPDIRIGHHVLDVMAHAFYPDPADGLGGDIHLDSGGPWSVDGRGLDFLQVITHELGHAIGLQHEFDRVAIMNPVHVPLFQGLGTSYLLPADIEQIRGLYGSGSGSVTPAPMPEPGTFLLVGLGLGALVRRYRTASARSPQ